MIKKLMKKEEGFTLAELLIVVAIIAVLVAVSIPIFTSRLEKARESTDVANFRSAKAAFISEYLSDPSITGALGAFDANSGTIVTDESDVTGYGKGTTIAGGTDVDGYDQDADYTDAFITCEIDPDGKFLSLKWMKDGSEVSGTGINLDDTVGSGTYTTGESGESNTETFR